MKALILERPGQLRLQGVAPPGAPGPGDALIRVRSIGVCGTDYHAFKGEQPFFTYPRILGHELGVEVMAIGDGVTEVSVGDQCAVRPYFADGVCPACRHGTPNCCQHINVFGVHSDGGMRELAIVPAAYLHPSASLSFDNLALVEPLAIGAHAVARGAIQVGERVLVVGAGPIGLAVTQFAVLAGAEVSVMDISEQRLAFCQRQWPAVICLDVQGDALATLQQLGGDDLPTAVFDATGNRASMQLAFSYVGHGGRLIFVGFHQGDVSFHNPTFHSHELTVMGSRNALSADFRRIIATMEADQLAIDSWITHRASLDETANVFPQWLEPNCGIIKGIITA